jgi:hypothetical protein
MAFGAPRALQVAIGQALVADAGVSALIGDRIYDQMPEKGEYPCIEFGPIDIVPDDQECVDGQIHTLQLNVWSRDQGRLGPCQDIVWAVRAALHDAELELPDPFAVCFVRVVLARVIPDPDGITAHGVVSVEATVEA